MTSGWEWERKKVMKGGETKEFVARYLRSEDYEAVVEVSRDIYLCPCHKLSWDYVPERYHRLVADPHHVFIGLWLKRPLSSSSSSSSSSYSDSFELIGLAFAAFVDEGRTRFGQGQRIHRNHRGKGYAEVLDEAVMVLLGRVGSAKYPQLQRLMWSKYCDAEHQQFCLQYLKKNPTSRLVAVIAQFGGPLIPLLSSTSTSASSSSSIEGENPDIVFQIQQQAWQAHQCHQTAGRETETVEKPRELLLNEANVEMLYQWMKEGAAALSSDKQGIIWADWLVDDLTHSSVQQFVEGRREGIPQRVFYYPDHSHGRTPTAICFLSTRLFGAGPTLVLNVLTLDVLALTAFVYWLTPLINSILSLSSSSPYLILHFDPVLATAPAYLQMVDQLPVCTDQPFHPASYCATFTMPYLPPAKL